MIKDKQQPTSFQGHLQGVATCLLVTLSIMTGLTGCSGGGDSTQALESDHTLVTYVTKGPMTGAKCQLFNAQSTLIAGPISSDAGIAEFPGLEVRGLHYVQCQGGTYTDEATNLPVNAGTFLMRSIFEIAPKASGETTWMVVSPLTEIAFQLANGDNDLSDYFTHHQTVANALGLNGINIAGAFPASALEGPLTTNTPEELYGIVLATFSQWANNINLTGTPSTQDITTLINRLVVDLQDGTFSTEKINFSEALHHIGVSTVGAGANIALPAVEVIMGNIGTPLDSVDTIPPTVTPPADLQIVAPDNGGLAATTPSLVTFLQGATATDNRQVVGQISHDGPSTFPVGTTTVTFSATDAAGNIGTVTATVTVLIAPTLKLTLAPIKTFRFSWLDVSPATHYRLFENPDGITDFSQVGGDILPGTQTVDHIVPLYARLNSQYRLQSCYATTCANSNTITITDTLLSSIGYLKANNLNDDLFGHDITLNGTGTTLAISLDHSGMHVAIGAPNEASQATGIDGDQTDTTRPASGAVHLFTRQANNWIAQSYLKASNTDGGDAFGQAISLSDDGTTLAVGAPNESSQTVGINGNQSDNTRPEAGAVYLFTRTGTSWTQQAYLKASNTNAMDRFGWSVSLSQDGNTLAVSAPGEASFSTGVNGDQNDNSKPNAGAVFIFTRTSGSWSQQAYLKASNPDSHDGFGFLTQLNNTGDTLAVSAGYEDSNATGINGDQANNSQPDAGAVYLFKRTGMLWSQQAYLKASNTESRDHFGSGMGLSGDGHTLAVAASGEDSQAIGINGDQADNTVIDAGAVYLFAFNPTTNSWQQQSYLKANNPEPRDFFGGIAGTNALSLSGTGDRLVVGAPFEDSQATGLNGNSADNSAVNAGAAYLFTHTATGWQPSSYLKANNTSANNEFGGDVVLSRDGKTLAIGAWLEQSPAAGTAPAKTGAVYLY